MCLEKCLIPKHSFYSLSEPSNAWPNTTELFKGIFSDSYNIFLWHESENIKEKTFFQNFSWFQFYIFKLCMIMCVSLLP